MCIDCAFIGCNTRQGPSPASTSPSTTTTPQHSHIMEHLIRNKHRLAFELHGGAALVCGPCKDLVHDAAFEEVVRLEHFRANALTGAASSSAKDAAAARKKRAGIANGSNELEAERKSAGELRGTCVVAAA